MTIAMNETVVALPDTLPRLAKELRAALDADVKVERRVRAEWAESKLRVIEVLSRAKQKIPDTQKFSHWLVDTGNNDLNKNDQAAAINLGKDLDLARRVLLDAKSWSLEIIWRDHKGLYEDVSNVARLPIDRNSQPNENAPDSATTVTQKPDLVTKFGEKVGRPIYDHFNNGSRNTRTTKLLYDLNKGQAKKLAKFVVANADLPIPANSDRLGVRTIWREAPQALCNQYPIEDEKHQGRTLMRVLDDWPGKLGPLYVAWVTAKKPDPTAWYQRITPMPQAVPASVVTGDTNVIVISDGMTQISDRIRKDAEAAAKPKADPTCRAAHHGTIRHHGVEIWPGKSPRYTFNEAWLAMTIWHTIDGALRASQDNPRTRCAGFHKPFIGCMRNLNPAAGEALSRIIHAQSAYPEKTGKEDNECPPYDVIQ